MLYISAHRSVILGGRQVRLILVLLTACDNFPEFSPRQLFFHVDHTVYLFCFCPMFVPTFSNVREIVQSSILIDCVQIFCFGMV